MSIHPMTAKEFRQSILFAALLYLTYKFIALVAGLVLIISVSTIVALVLDPVVSWLERKKIKRQWSAGILALIVLGLLATAVGIVITPATREIKDLWATIPQQASKAQNMVLDFLDRNPDIKNAIPTEMPNINLSNLTGPLIGGATKATAGVAGAITGAFLAFICLVYMMANPKPLIEGILKPMSPVMRSRAQTAGSRIAYSVRAWAVGILIGMVFIFIITWIALAIIGVKQAFLFALIAGILEAVPVIGPILSAFPPLIVTLVQNPSMAIAVVVAFLIIQQIEGNILIPLVMSRQLSLHPIAVLFALIAMGGLFGVLGVFLATPATVAANIIYDEFYLKPRLDVNGVVNSDDEDLV